MLLEPFGRSAGLVGLGEFNLGKQHDFRVPDAGFVRGVPNQVFVPAAAIVVEILSSGDETWEKLPFYAHHGVEELCIADPPARRLRWFVRRGEAYEETGRSDLLGVSGEELEGRIDWPG